MNKRLTTRWTRRLSLFKRNEEGSMVVMTLFLIIAMIWTAGIAVDMMRFETYRARLQSTIDRAVLAAADLDVCLDFSVDPADIVRDFVEKNGFGDQLQDIQVDRDDSSCAVTAQARIDVNTIFMKLIGFGEINTGHQQLGTTASSGATESIEDVEISLVLDVSGSMRGNKIVQLRSAASDFVEVITDSIDEQRLMISVVPYSTTVSIGPDLMAQYGRTHTHTESYCLDLPVSTYSSTGIDPLVRYPQSGHFDADGGASYSQIRPATNWVCNPEPESYVLPFQHEIGALQGHIRDLEANAWTSIEMGANWGVALLDPGTQDVTSGLIAQGVVDSRHEGRPAAFDPTQTLKVLVLMTDGENTRDYVLATTRRHQWSNVWYAWNMDYDDDGDFNGDSYPYVDALNVLAADPVLRGRSDLAEHQYNDRNPERQFFVRDREAGDFDGDGQWQERHYWVEGIFVDHDGDDDTALRRDDSPPVWTNQRYGARQTYDDIWARFTIRAHAWNFRGDQRNDFGLYNSWYNDIVTVTYGGEKDRRLDLICDAAKAEGIVIFTIGFEVSDRAANVMSNCATSPNHFYRVDGLEIASAFNSIANQISALRLFQ